MTASYDIPPEYKVYIGRLFILRKCEKISASRTKKFGCESRTDYLTKETFGDAVMILDETNSKVLVTTLLTTPLWVAKYYLYREVQAPDDSEKVNILVDMLVDNGVQLSNKVRLEIAKYLRKK